MTTDLARRIRVGTSGWSYAHWRGVFYPRALPRTAWLAHYGQCLDTVEINNSFYRLPALATLQGWRETVADDFVFSVKASRFITHMTKLSEPELTLPPWFTRIAALAPKLGPILFQLPPRWRLDLARLRQFLAALPGDYRYAFEFRDRSWWVGEVYELLASHRAAFCIYDLAGVASPREITSDIVYVRLHGPDGPYRGCYDSAALAAWVDACVGWAAQERTVYCYFDNDQDGHAALNAQRMRQMLPA